MLTSEIDYYSRPEVSNSSLTWLKKYFQPAWAVDLYNIFRIGTLVDVMITEAHKLDYFRRTIDQYSYTQKEIDHGQRMKDAFYRNPLCKNIAEAAAKQKISVRENFRIEYCGYIFYLAVRCKWDLFVDGYDMSADIKTTSCKTQAAFEKSILTFDYDRQGAFYLDIENRDNFLFIGISKEDRPQIFTVAMRRGDALYNSGKAKYQELAFKHWCLF